MKNIIADLIKDKSSDLLLKEGGFLSLATDENIKEILLTQNYRGKQNPLFSVIIPTYNRCDLLKNALTSVLNQDFTMDNFEIIVVGDGCTDSTKILMENFFKNNPEASVTYIELRKNFGPSFARNYGIKFSKGSLIAFTDDDCIVPSDWLSGFSEKFKTRPDLAGAGGWKKPSNPEKESIFDRFIYWRRTPFMRKEFLSCDYHPENNCGDTANVCYKKEVLTQVGGFNTYFRYLEDWEFKIRVHREGLPLLYFPRMVSHQERIGLIEFIRHHLNFGRESYFIRVLHPGVTLSPSSFTRTLAISFRESRTALFSKTVELYFIPLSFLRSFLLWFGSISARLMKF